MTFANRHTRIAIGIMLALGVTAYISFLWTGKRACGRQEPARVRVQLLDEDTGIPIAGARVFGLRDGQVDDFMMVVGNDTSNEVGWVDMDVGGYGFGYNGWQLFWLIEMGELRPLYTIRFEHPSYVPRELRTSEILGRSGPTWQLDIAGERLTYYSRKVPLTKADHP